MSTFERAAQRLMSMDDAAWARHANPISVWSRFSILPLFAIAVWSRVWIGPWAWGAVAAVVLWTWGNPRLFAVPKTTTSWASRGVLGERLFIDGTGVTVELRRITGFLKVIGGFAAVIYGIGLWQLDFWMTACGLCALVISKTWFVDRMVVLYDADNSALKKG